jgi:hypothetical protein
MNLGCILNELGVCVCFRVPMGLQGSGEALNGRIRCFEYENKAAAPPRKQKGNDPELA